ncbi:MAG: alpha/beta hydrolase [Bacteroides sp.]|nr:alpha/beta hydrolase [Bacteroides sp.]
MKKAIRYSVATLIAILLLLVVASYYMLDFSLCPDPNKGRRIEASYEYMFQEYPDLKPWVDSLRTVDALQDTYIVNEQGVRLHALYIQAAQPTNNTAVIVHGYTDNAIRMLMIGYLYSYELNYNILLPDLYGHGESGGVEIQMGWKDRLDVLQWMEKANEMFGGDTHMVVHGISMGAATTMMVSGEVEHASRPYPYVKCFVEDCGYTSVWDEFSHELSQQFHLPDFPLLYTTSLLCNLRYGWTFGEASPLEQVKKCSLPMLFIHGDADTYVPTWMVHPLYEAKSEPKEIWISPGVAHALSYRDYPQEYTERVKNFVDKYIH